MKKLLKFCLFFLFICSAVENTKFSASKDFPIRLVRTFVPNQTNDKVIKSVVEKNILPAKKSTCDSSDETQFSSDLETFCSEKLKLDKKAVLPDYEERKIDEINRESTSNNNVINNPNRKNVRRSDYLETIIEEGTDNQSIPLCKLKNWQIRRLYSDYVGVRNQLKVDYNDFVDHFILIYSYLSPQYSMHLNTSNLSTSVRIGEICEDLNLQTNTLKKNLTFFSKIT